MNDSATFLKLFVIIKLNYLKVTPMYVKRGCSALARISDRLDLALVHNNVGKFMENFLEFQTDDWKDNLIALQEWTRPTIHPLPYVRTWAKIRLNATAGQRDRRVVSMMWVCVGGYLSNRRFGVSYWRK